LKSGYTPRSLKSPCEKAPCISGNNARTRPARRNLSQVKSGQEQMFARSEICCGRHMGKHIRIKDQVQARVRLENRISRQSSLRPVRSKEAFQRCLLASGPDGSWNRRCDGRRNWLTPRCGWVRVVEAPKHLFDATLHEETLPGFDSEPSTESTQLLNGTRTKTKTRGIFSPKDNAKRPYRRRKFHGVRWVYLHYPRNGARLE